jgi:hypothetical protein
LAYADYPTTVATFDNETSRRGRSAASRQGSAFQRSHEENSDQMMKAFNSGDATTFFSAWKSIIPAHVQENNPEAHRIEFLLQVYFAIYPKLAKTGVK